MNVMMKIRSPRRFVSNLMAGEAGAWLFKKTFSVWQSWGFHITSNNFYHPIPDTRTLDGRLWSKHSELIGIDMNESKQLELLALFASQFKDEYDSFPEHKTSNPHTYYVKNRWFASVDAEILYCMIRYFKPRRILEIGSGFSTYLSASAIVKNQEQNGRYRCEFVVIDPCPNPTVRSGFPGLSGVRPCRVQDIALSEFERLQEDDIFFIDSSHVLAIGSDVQYEYLEILPRLNRGVIIHAHDIYLPAEYAKGLVLRDHLFWTEQYLLQAFLAFNNRFEVLWAGNYMHLRHPEELKRAFKSYRSGDGERGSFWMRRVG